MVSEIQSFLDPIMDTFEKENLPLCRYTSPVKIDVPVKTKLSSRYLFLIQLIDKCIKYIDSAWMYEQISDSTRNQRVNWASSMGFKFDGLIARERNSLVRHYEARKAKDLEQEATDSSKKDVKQKEAVSA